MIYHLSGRKVLKYTEERQGFVVPNRYRLDPETDLSLGPGGSSTRAPALSSEGGTDGVEHDLDGSRSSDLMGDEATTTTAVNSRDEVEREGKVIVVDWYGDDDPENPQNWSVPNLSSRHLRPPAACPTKIWGSRLGLVEDRATDRC